MGQWRIAEFVACVGFLAACSSGSGSSPSTGGSAGMAGAGTGGSSGTGGTGGLGQGAWSGIDTDTKGSAFIACKPDSACTICVAENCNAEAQACYGENWQHQSFAAECGDFSTCYCACDPNSGSCLQGCMGPSFDVCRGCDGPVEACIQEKCNPVCCDFVPATYCADGGN